MIVTYLRVPNHTQIGKNLEVFEENRTRWEKAAHLFKDRAALTHKTLLLSSKLIFKEYKENEGFGDQVTRYGGNSFKIKAPLNQLYLECLRDENVNIQLLNPYMVLNSFRQGKSTIDSIEYFFVEENWYIRCTTRKLLPAFRETTEEISKDAFTLQKLKVAYSCSVKKEVNGGILYELEAVTSS